MKKWRKEAINNHKQEHWSEEENYLFISESHHALLTSIDTYEIKTKQRDNDKK